MKNLVFIFIFMNMLVPFAHSQVELDLEDDKIVREPIIAQEKPESIFTKDEKSYEEMEKTLGEYEKSKANYSRDGEESRLLDCNEEKFGELIRDAITKYQNANPQITSLEKRKHKLLIREFENFTEIPTDNITSKNSNLLAGEVIKLKINQKIDASDMKVCQAGNSPQGGYIYILMYKEQNYINVRILNVAYVGDIQALNFKY